MHEQAAETHQRNARLAIHALILVLALIAAHPLWGQANGSASGVGPAAAEAASAPGPSLTSPDDGTLLSQMSATLKWDPVPDAHWYQFQLIPFNNDGPGIDLVVGDTVKVAAASIDLPAPDFGGADPNYILLPGMTYTWRVRTASTMAVPAEADWSAWSARTFKTPTRSGATIGAVSPGDGALLTTRTPVLTWFNTDRTVFYYEIQMSKSPDFGPGAFLYDELIHGGLTRPPDSYAVPSQYQLEAGTQYYWRVRPRVQGDGVAATWSSVYSFRTS
jgi:hypothetical protein